MTVTEHRADGLQVQGDKGYQDSALSGVSRSFAFTIPQLPQALRPSVINAYLLCRVADTIEDHGPAEAAAKAALLERLQAVVNGGEADSGLPTAILQRLTEDAPAAERELVRNLPRVLRVNQALPAEHRRAIGRCVRILCEGMARFQTLRQPTGLADLGLFNQYCYHVAGVVGEMLTSLFCSYSPVLAARRGELLPLAVAFGQGLQMTNILKDVWEDRARGVCWLPRDVFARHGCALAADADWASDPAFHRGLQEMIAIARGQLAEAQAYTLRVPATEPGIRLFCSWAIGMALLTLRRIHRRPGYTAAAQVKISRSQLGRVILLSNLAVRHDWALRSWFQLTALGLPQARPPAAVPTRKPTA